LPLILLESPTDLINWAESFAKRLEPGDLILCDGEMGVGKTTMAQGIANGLEIKANITSPSFTKLNIYPGKWTFHHLDLYNVTSIDELEALGIYDFLEPYEGVTLVEWWDMFPEIFTESAWRIHLKKHPKGRLIELFIPGNNPESEDNNV